mgnify:CR=1 FL=1
MKKVLLILILFLSCYFIYNKTSDNKLYYLTIGDSLSRGTNEYGIVTYGYNEYVKEYLEENNKLEGFNKTYTDNDYRIIDIIKSVIYAFDLLTLRLSYWDLSPGISRPLEEIVCYIDQVPAHHE